MKVKPIVANIAPEYPGAAASFYHDVLGLELLMDQGAIVTYGAREKAVVQVSLASQGGSGTPVPTLSIGVDDVDEGLARVRTAGIGVEYAPVDEPWGVRRFLVRDPFGTLDNIMSHV